MAVDFPILEGSLARFEPLREDHLPGLLSVGLDPELWRWTVTSVRTPDDIRRYVAAPSSRQRWAVPFPSPRSRNPRCGWPGSTRFASVDRHAFESMNCLRELKTDALNRQGRTAILRIGAREEGTLRSHMVTETGRSRDTVSYSIPADEWPTVRCWFEEWLG